jgi:hypothetical protein
MPGNGMNTANINQLPDQYLALGLGATDQLTALVNNPYFGKGGTGVIGGQQVAYNQLLRPFPEFASVNLNDYTAHAKYDAHRKSSKTL